MKKAANTPDFKALLAERGLRPTPRRVTVLAELMRERTPLTAEELAKRLSSSLDQATLYRTLESFEKAGLVRRVDFRHSHAHYELALDHHHHLICTDCERVEEIPYCPESGLEKKIARTSRHFARVSDHAFELYGLCKQCA